jgi:acyl carrier protein
MDTAARLRALIASCGPLRDGALGADPAAELRSGLGYDSLDVADLACEVRKAFGLELPLGAEAAWVTVGDVARYVQEHAAKETTP